MSPIELAASALRDSYGGKPIASLRNWLEPDDTEAAYAVQAANRQHWLAQGRKLVGYKIGLTSVAAQAVMGTSEPSYGALYADARVADGGMLDPGMVIAPRVEGEVALVLGAAITDPEVSRETVMKAVASAHAAIEICDSRIADWKIALADTLADNGSAGCFVLAESGRAIAGLDLFSCGMVLAVDGGIATLGAGAAAGGHPLNGLTWLARKLAGQGQPLPAGAIVLTGSLGAVVPVSSGARVSVTIGGLGNCSFRLGE